METLTCGKCSRSFPHSRPGGRRPQYCSAECRKAGSRDYINARKAARRRLGQCVECPQSDIKDASGGQYCTVHAGLQDAHNRRRHLGRYGLTEEQYAALYARQDGRCAICRVPAGDGRPRLSIDHDHACCPGDSSCGGCVRGLLCYSCNAGIGMFNDDLDVMQAAANYIRDRRE